VAYFSNGNEGMCFDEQCMECKYGEDCCPIFYVQCNYNYEACNNKTAREILDHLVDNNGNCRMFQMYKKDFKKVKDDNLTLFDEIFGKDEKDSSITF